MDAAAKRSWREATSGQARAECDRLIRRIELQLAFAKDFVATTGAGEDRAKVVASCQGIVEKSAPQSGVAGLAQICADIENKLADIGKAAKTHTIHCVGHGHIDMNWMWSWPETVATTHDTFASVLDLMDKVPEFTYSQSQASVYAAIEKYHPAQFEQIKERVKEGRWEVTASHWVEGDKNLASGESIIRHLLLTRRYFEEKFGLGPEDVPVDWEPDTFGHAATVPMIDASGGVKYLYACRPGGGWNHPRVGESRPPLFWWRSPDGSQILVCRETTWYNSYVNIGDDISAPMLAAVRATPGLKDWMHVYGVGNHGGGPTRTEVDYLQELATWPIFPKVVFSTSKRYFEALVASGLNLHVLDHELNFEFTGCYTSQSLIKQANRLGENYCVEAESLASITGLDRRDMLREAWISVLFNQFHDILPGSGVRETREHARALFQEVGALTGAVKRDALSLLCDQVDTASMAQTESEESALAGGAGQGAGHSGLSRASGGGKSRRAFVIYNPCAWPRSEPVRLTLYDTDWDENAIVAWDETGTAHPTQSLGKGHDWGHDKLTILLLAQDIPALGYRTYVLGEGTPTAVEPMVTARTGTAFTTRTLDCEFDRVSGGFNSAGQAGQLGRWMFEHEAPTGMSAWIIGQSLGRTPLTATQFDSWGFGRDAASAMVREPYCLAAHVSSKLKSNQAPQSHVQLNALVHPLSPRIDFEATADWREIGGGEAGIPGLVVDFDLHAQEFLCEAPFGVVRRRVTAGDVPSLRFVHAFDHSTGRGITVLQDGKYGFQLREDGIGMRVVRSSYDPDPTPEVAVTTFRYAVALHDSPPSNADLIRLGAEWNHPLIAVPTGIHSGGRAPRHGFVRVENPSVVVTSLKQTEDGQGVVLRLQECDGQSCVASLIIDPALAPEGWIVTPCDAMERPNGEDVAWQGETIHAQVPAFGIASVLLRPPVAQA